MRINFFEEYPTENNMAKLDLVSWPSTVFIATHSLNNFEIIYEKYSGKYPNITFGWWPTIPGSYWVSGLANTTDLKKLFSEITSKVQKIELPVLIDLELPRKKSFYIKNIFSLNKNKKIIENFITKAPQYNLKIYTAEYSAFGRLSYCLYRLLGLSPSFSFQHIKIPMCYSSMGIKSFGCTIWNKVKKFEKQFTLRNPGRVALGLGTTAIGVLGNEPIITSDMLAQDIRWAREGGAEEVFIFRLGGLNQDYHSVVIE